MAAESPRRLSRPVGTVICRPLPVSDKTAFGSVVDFFTDIYQQPNSGSLEEKEKITWVKFAYADINENLSEHQVKGLDGSPPLVLVLGFNNGVQIWTIPANGEAQEVLSWRHGPVKVFALVCTPIPVGSGQDLFLKKRPMVVMNDPISLIHANFFSLRTGELVIKKTFPSPICNILCNKKVIVFTFQENITVLDACTLKESFFITSSYISSGPNINPVALGTDWLAFSDRRVYF